MYHEYQSEFDYSLKSKIQQEQKAYETIYTMKNGTILYTCTEKVFICTKTWKYHIESFFFFSPCFNQE